MLSFVVSRQSSQAAIIKRLLLERAQHYKVPAVYLCNVVLMPRAFCIVSSCRMLTVAQVDQVQGPLRRMLAGKAHMRAADPEGRWRSTRKRAPAVLTAIYVAKLEIPRQLARRTLDI